MLIMDKVLIGLWSDNRTVNLVLLTSVSVLRATCFRGRVPMLDAGKVDTQLPPLKVAVLSTRFG